MLTSIRKPATLLITGASSGIGEALASAYSAEGVTLFLTGRNAERLEGVADQCRAAGAVVETSLVSVTDRDGMRTLIESWYRSKPIDLVIANAGVSGRGAPLAEDGDANPDTENARDIFAVNLAGVLNTVEPVIPLMAREGGGQIAIMSSLAGFRGLPSAPAYAASKAAVRSWGEGLRGQLTENNIAVNVICPGFVESRITDQNDFHMPFMLEAPEAAEIIRRGLAKNRGRIAFPLPMSFAVWLFSLLPIGFTDWLAARLPRKS